MVAWRASASCVLPSARASSALFLTPISARATPRENGVDGRRMTSSSCGAASSSCGAASSSCGAASSPADSLGRASSSGCAAGSAVDSLVRARFGGSACASAICSRCPLAGRELPFQAHAANVGFVKPSCCALGPATRSWRAVSGGPSNTELTLASGCKTLARALNLTNRSKNRRTGGC